MSTTPSTIDLKCPSEKPIAVCSEPSCGSQVTQVMQSFDPTMGLVTGTSGTPCLDMLQYTCGGVTVCQDIPDNCDNAHLMKGSNDSDPWQLICSVSSPGS
jgi:hypothetical protein